MHWHILVSRRKNIQFKPQDSIKCFIEMALSAGTAVSAPETASPGRRLLYFRVLLLWNLQSIRQSVQQLKERLDWPKRQVLESSECTIFLPLCCQQVEMILTPTIPGKSMDTGVGSESDSSAQQTVPSIVLFSKRSYCNSV